MYIGWYIRGFTLVNYNGASLVMVDYMAATLDLRESVISFDVQNLAKFSDHKACLCKIAHKHSFMMQTTCESHLRTNRKKRNGTIKTKICTSIFFAVLQNFNRESWISQKPIAPTRMTFFPSTSWVAKNSWDHNSKKLSSCEWTTWYSWLSTGKAYAFIKTLNLKLKPWA